MDQTTSWINFVYDFERKTYDSTNWWASLSGAPVEDATGLKLNAASTTMLGDFWRGRIEMKMIIPTAPTAGNFRQWGFKEGGSNTFALFRISGTTFSAVVSSEEYGVSTTTSSTMTWNTAWNATETIFSIDWDASGFTFRVNGQRLAKISDPSAMPNGSALSPYFENSVSDDMYLLAFEMKGSQAFRNNAQASGQGTSGRKVRVSDSSTVGEALTMFTDRNYASSSDAVTVGETVSVVRS